MKPFYDPEYMLKPVDASVLKELAEELHDLHVRTGISLDNWTSARTFVEAYFGYVEENGA